MNHFRYKYLLKPFFLIWDLTGFVLAYLIAWSLQAKKISFEHILYPSNIESIYIVIASLILWILFSLILDMQHVPHRKNNKQIFKYFYYPQVIFCLLILIFIIISNFDSLSRLFIIYYFTFQFIFLLISRIIRIIFVRKLRFRGHNSVRLGIIASLKIHNKIKSWINDRPWSGINIYDKDPNIILENYSNLIKDLKVGDYLLIDKNFIANKAIYNEIIVLAEDVGLQIFEIIINSQLENSSNNKKISKFGPFYTFKYRNQPLKTSINQINKRFFDFCFSFLFIVFLFWWLHIIILILIKMTSKGPIFYRQKRVGQYGRFFNCIKYRTMNVHSHVTSGITQKNDPRIYPFGNFLRKTNLDEIPQFINVLLGEMSIVGPRPHMIKEDDMLAEELNKYRIRHWVRPGITGLSAVNGYRGGTENMELMQQRIDFDIEYIENWSLLNDVKICFRTFGAMLLRNNIGH